MVWESNLLVTELGSLGIYKDVLFDERGKYGVVFLAIDKLDFLCPSLTGGAITAMTRALILA
jgi:hypothetical protein